MTRKAPQTEADEPLLHRRRVIRELQLRRFATKMQPAARAASCRQPAKWYRSARWSSCARPLTPAHAEESLFVSRRHQHMIARQCRRAQRKPSSANRVMRTVPFGTRGRSTRSVFNVVLSRLEVAARCHCGDAWHKNVKTTPVAVLAFQRHRASDTYNAYTRRWSMLPKRQQATRQAKPRRCHCRYSSS